MCIKSIAVPPHWLSKRLTTTTSHPGSVAAQVFVSNVQLAVDLGIRRIGGKFDTRNISSLKRPGILHSHLCPETWCAYPGAQAPIIQLLSSYKLSLEYPHTCELRQYQRLSRAYIISGDIVQFLAQHRKRQSSLSVPWLAGCSFPVAQYIFSVPTVDTVLPSPDLRSHHISKTPGHGAQKIYALVATVGLLAHVVGGPNGADSWFATPVTRLLGTLACGIKEHGGGMKGCITSVHNSSPTSNGSPTSIPSTSSFPHN